MSPDLIRRILSALVLAPIVLGAVWLGGLPFQIMLGVVIVLASYEWSRLTCGTGAISDLIGSSPSHASAPLPNPPPFRGREKSRLASPPLVKGRDREGISHTLESHVWFKMITNCPGWYIDAVIIAGTALAAMLATVMDNLNLPGWIILAGMAVSGALGWFRGQELRWRLLGVPYISLGPASLIWLRGQEDSGFLLTIWLLLLIWAMDIGAYIAGRAIGGPKLAPRASPNKTWAGLIGGVLGAATVGGFFGWSAPLVTAPAPVLQMALMSALIGAWSQVGDIAESMVKRHFGVKDMSNLIPGHGGLLDRIDGLLFAAPAMAIGVLIMLAIGT